MGKEAVIPKYIIIHHSLTADSQTVSWDAIRRYHVETLGWKDVGYHYGLELVGYHYEIIFGRMWDEVGAHCIGAGMNQQSLGICVVGNYDVTDLPEPAFQLLVKFVKSLMRLHGIPAENVKRHSDYDPKSCPGRKFPWDRFRTALL